MISNALTSAPALDRPGATTEVAGVVVRGDQRGRTLGFPTANLTLEDAALDDGVWAGWLVRASGEVLPCAISVGRRSTFYAKEGERLLEAHVIDFEGCLYGEQVTVVLSEHLRRQMRFDNIDGLVGQLNSDVARVRMWTAAQAARRSHTRP